jgi:hypothetical protein
MVIGINQVTVRRASKVTVNWLYTGKTMYDTLWMLDIYIQKKLKR